MSYSIMIQKRHPNILKITGILIVYWFAVGMPILAVTFGHLDRFKGNGQLILDRTNSITFPMCTIGIFITIAWRFWHIHFDLKYSSSQKNSEWKYHLDPDLVEHNFWLTHKKDYGSSSYTKKIVIVWYILVIATLSITYQCLVGTVYYFFVGHGVNVVIHASIMVIIMIIAWKINPYSDHFFIRDELIKVCIAMAIAIGVTGIAIIYGVLSSPILLMMLAGIGACVLFLVVQLVSFAWIPRKIQTEELKHKLAKMMDKNTEHSVDSVSISRNHLDDNLGRIVRRISTNGPTHTKSYQLHIVLSNHQTFKTFIQHLAKEFSTECLLCFAEIIQYKHSMLQRFNIIKPGTITETSNFAEKCPLTDIVPLSSINKSFEQNLSKYKYNDDESFLMSECRNICFQLYHKYIATGSELEVNISFGERTRLKNLLADREFCMGFNITANELFCLYDEVAIVMFRLMNGAYGRFKLQPEFEYVVKTLNEQHVNVI